MSDGGISDGGAFFGISEKGISGSSSGFIVGTGAFFCLKKYQTKPITTITTTIQKIVSIILKLFS
ncbi:hypothetical protein KJA16_03130 [Patescibacteria group bacterium]|nr:hypothetical protein [Patescibacteria group bacterium]